MTTLGVDTSVAVPLLIQTHTAHAEVVRWWGGREIALSGHALAETYSVLTRLPGDLRLAPADAARLITERFVEPLSSGPMRRYVFRTCSVGSGLPAEPSMTHWSHLPQPSMVPASPRGRPRQTDLRSDRGTGCCRGRVTADAGSLGGACATSTGYSARAASRRARGRGKGCHPDSWPSSRIRQSCTRFLVTSAPDRTSPGRREVRSRALQTSGSRLAAVVAHGALGSAASSRDGRDISEASKRPERLLRVRPPTSSSPTSAQDQVPQSPASTGSS